MPTDLEIKRALTEVGITLVNGALTVKYLPDSFWLEQGLREFQRYASLPNIARTRVNAGLPQRSNVYPDTLVSFMNPKLYDGKIHGIADQKTTDLLNDWQQGGYRVPVVVSAWPVNSKKERIDAPKDVRSENLWLWTDSADVTVRMFVTDFSGVYGPIPGTGVNDVPYEKIGTNEGRKARIADVISDTATPSATDYKVVLNVGPVGDAGFAEFQVDYKTLTGDDPVAAPSAGTKAEWQQSVFRVIYGVATAEGGGGVDVFNARDNSFLSLGFFQWTVGQVGKDGLVAKGELGPLLALAKPWGGGTGGNQDTFNQLLGFWGLCTSGNWDASQAMYVSSLAAYNCYLQECVDATGTMRNIVATERGDMLRGWHWCHRMQQTLRSSLWARQAMWMMARIRLRDVLATPWPVGPAATDEIWPISTTGKVTLGMVFASELSVAILLRWHVWSPAEIVSDGVVGRGARLAFTQACSAVGRSGIGPTKPIEDWGASPNIETALVKALLSVAGTRFKAGNGKVVAKTNRKDLIGSLDRLRRSRTANFEQATLSQVRGFKAPIDGLPPAPAATMETQHA